MPTPSPDLVCPACGRAADFRVFAVREMQYGTREEFAYRECAGCGTLHIAAVPPDLSRHYPDKYYSFLVTRPRRRWVPWHRRVWSRWVVTSPDPLAAAVARGFARGRYAFFHWARLGRVRLDSAILDLGCGGGMWMRRMQRYGFTRLSGVDPYAPEEFDEEGFRIRRAEISAVREKFDYIMMNHVLEHVADPAQALIQARERLAPGGRILVRIPVAGSFLHREFGVHWFNLDAPRHLVIPSLQGVLHLAERSHTRILHRGFDGQEVSHWGSDNYRRGIVGPDFPPAFGPVLRPYRRQVRELNASGDSDFGVFVLAPNP